MTVLKFEPAPGEASNVTVATGYKLFTIRAYANKASDTRTRYEIHIICHTCGHREASTGTSPTTNTQQWKKFHITSYEVWDDDEMHTSVECCSCGAIEGKPGTYEIVRAW